MRTLVFERDINGIKSRLRIRLSFKPEPIQSYHFDIKRDEVDLSQAAMLIEEEYPGWNLIEWRERNTKRA